MGRPTDRETIVAKLAEWGITLSECELNELLPAYENLLRWQGILEEMLRGREILEGRIMPESEPLLIHGIERKGGQR